jgi:spermidine synthase
VSAALYFLFFCSGLTGLVYQVIWVRIFGNVFGNTVYSTSLVVAVFMLGLGVGSYIAGAWADRQYASEQLPAPRSQGTAKPPAAPARTSSLLRAYGYFEIGIAIAGLGLSFLLPQLDRVSALVSSYSRDPSGWYVLSTWAYVIRAVVVVALLSPVTLLMGGTLTLLVRHLVRHDVDAGGIRVAFLYGINTLGAAAGAFLTDFSLVPSIGLWRTQLLAVLVNVLAGTGALWLAHRAAPLITATSRQKVRRSAPLKRRTDSTAAEIAKPAGADDVGRPGGQADLDMTARARPSDSLVLTSAALAMSGFAAMGMEIVWLRHFTILLGQFRAVFSLLLTVILLGAGAGSLLSGFLRRRSGASALSFSANTFMVVQGLFAACTLLGLTLTDATHIEDIVSTGGMFQAFAGRAADPAFVASAGLARTFTELWFNLRPILLEVGVPALLMGFAFPLGNAIVQRAERLVGRRAGVLYLSNTVGAVCGSLAAGFLLLPVLGLQASATVLTIAALSSVVPLYFASAALQADAATATRGAVSGPPRGAIAALFASMLVGGAAIASWLLLPSNYILTSALAQSRRPDQLLSVHEGLTEVVAVADVPGQGRRLLTNGHPMSSTTAFAQRYMRTLTHIPLLAMDHPEDVLVIGFGVGNTTHAATLHPSIRRIEVADLSRDILGSASYFHDVNGGVLGDPRVVVYVNDGRHHLHMQPPASYDLITLEPPPIGYAGVSALYSREFYALARTRLKPKGYLSQWLPAYQVPGTTTLAMIRAFIDVFPQAVLLSGAGAELILLGARDSSIEIDPVRLTAALAAAPAAHADLRRLNLGRVREIVGAFVASAQTLRSATGAADAVSDDRPIQEYGVRSLLNPGEAVPGSVVDLSQCAVWCPGCFANGQPTPLVEGLDTYLALLGRAYAASPAELGRAGALAEQQHRVIEESAYLGAVVPETADVHNLLGIDHARNGRMEDAIGEFRQALQLDPGSAAAYWHLGAALASRGSVREAIESLRRSVQLDPNNLQARHDLEVMLVSEDR